MRNALIDNINHHKIFLFVLFIFRLLHQLRLISSHQGNLLSFPQLIDMFFICRIIQWIDNHPCFLTLSTRIITHDSRSYLLPFVHHPSLVLLRHLSTNKYKIKYIQKSNPVRFVILLHFLCYFLKNYSVDRNIHLSEESFNFPTFFWKHPIYIIF